MQAGGAYTWDDEDLTGEAINRFTTAEVRIEQTNHNSISKDVDVDGIMDYWADWFAEKLDVSYEGVHG